MALDQKDAFRDLQFNGQPSGYRDFRRKVILNVAGLEDKYAYLAGPRLLSKLSGEAWRATEHLSVGSLRQPDGWLKVIKALDDHYKFLPETELHDAIEEFLFMLKRRPNEGATSFSSRFRTQLDRVQTLIAQERDVTRKKRKRKHGKSSRPPSRDDEQSSLEETDKDSNPAVERTSSVEPPAFDPFAADAEAPGERPESDARPPSVGGHAATDPVRSKPPSTIGGGSKKSKISGRGTFKEDHAYSQKKMQQMLGTLELGHTKPTPIFPQSVLGHLYMRKYGLSREQRAQIIRATNGSSRFQDVERIMKASDLEDRRSHEKGHQKPQRRDTYAVQHDSQQVLIADGDDSSDLMDADDMTSNSSDHDILEAEGPDEDSNDEAQEILELHKKSKEKFKKAFRSYKDSKKKVREIKKSRQQSYYPVVALNQPAGDGQSAASSQVPLKQPFKYDKKSSSSAKGSGKKKPESSTKYRKEEANLTETVLQTAFNYMVSAIGDNGTDVMSEEVLLASIPNGYAIIDTVCTTSVIGRDCADQLMKFLQEHQMPLPERKQLPPVELKGFSGEATQATEGLVWHVQLGNLWGTITTYVVPGRTAFLLSRRVLEGMEAQLNLGRKTLTSKKHGLNEMMLRQASNGHLLMPLWNLPVWSPKMT